MTLLGLIIALLILGVILWAINAAPFIDAGIKKIIYIVVVLVVVIWILSSLGGGSILDKRIFG